MMYAVLVLDRLGEHALDLELVGTRAWVVRMCDHLTNLDGMPREPVAIPYARVQS